MTINALKACTKAIIPVNADFFLNVQNIATRKNTGFGEALYESSLSYTKGYNIKLQYSTEKMQIYSHLKCSTQAITEIKLPGHIIGGISLFIV